MNTGDTAFMMICLALVFFMTPGLLFGIVACDKEGARYGLNITMLFSPYRAPSLA